MDFRGAGEQSWAGLKDIRRIEGVQFAALDGGDFLEIRACADGIKIDPLSTPTGEDKVGIGGDDFVGREVAFRGGSSPSGGKDVFTAAPFDEFTDPTDAADQRIGPFLEIDAWTWRGVSFQRCEIAGELRGQFLRLASAPDGAADEADGLRDLGESALISGEDGAAGADELPGDIGLHVGKRDDQIGLLMKDAVSVRCRKATDYGTLRESFL